MSEAIRVPYNYLPMQFADYSEIAAGWDALIKTADFTLGAFMEKFEREFADYIGSPHCLATNKGPTPSSWRSRRSVSARATR